MTGTSTAVPFMSVTVWVPGAAPDAPADPEADDGPLEDEPQAAREVRAAAPAPRPVSASRSRRDKRVFMGRFSR